MEDLSYDLQPFNPKEIDTVDIDWSAKYLRCHDFRVSKPLHIKSNRIEPTSN